MTPSHGVPRILLAVAIGALLPIGSANALEILGNKFADPMMSSTGSDVDVSGYGRIYILGNSIPTARESAQGPVRTETMPNESAAAHAQAQRKLYILGNTFWLPGKEGSE